MSPTEPSSDRVTPAFGSYAWIDASAGLAGDMLLGALVNAGAPLHGIREAVRAVLGEAVRLNCATVTRAGLRATKVDVEVIEQEIPERTWRTIRTMVSAAPLAGRVRGDATRVFGTLAVEATIRAVSLVRRVVTLAGLELYHPCADVGGHMVRRVPLGRGEARGDSEDRDDPIRAQSAYRECEQDGGVDASGEGHAQPA